MTEELRIHKRGTSPKLTQSKHNSRDHQKDEGTTSNAHICSARQVSPVYDKNKSSSKQFRYRY